MLGVIRNSDCVYTNATENYLLITPNKYMKVTLKYTLIGVAS